MFLLSARRFGRRYQVHPVAVVVALVVWVSLWGFIGALVSTPFLILLRIILEEQRHPVAQGFYRILRGRIRANSSAANGNGAADHADTGCDRIKAPAPPAGEATVQTPSGGEGRSNRPAVATTGAPTPAVAADVDTPDVDNGKDLLSSSDSGSLTLMLIIYYLLT